MKPRLTTVTAGNTAVVMTRPTSFDRSMKYIIDLASPSANQSFECLIRYIDTEFDHVEYGILGSHQAELSVSSTIDKVVLSINNKHSEDVKVLVTPLTDIAINLY